MGSRPNSQSTGLWPTPPVRRPRYASYQSAGLSARVEAAARQYPCDLLFVHRDAEREGREKRVEEIREATAPFADLRHVCVIPVRMTETWLLIDTDAIRRAADNPHSQIAIDLPHPRELEEVTEPKKLLQQLLIDASEMRGRRRERFRRDLAWRCQRVSEFIDDFSSLLSLPSFALFHEETRLAIEALLKSEGNRQK